MQCRECRKALPRRGRLCLPSAQSRSSVWTKRIRFCIVLGLRQQAFSCICGLPGQRLGTQCRIRIASWRGAVRPLRHQAGKNLHRHMSIEAKVAQAARLPLHRCQATTNATQQSFPTADAALACLLPAASLFQLRMSPTVFCQIFQRYTRGTPSQDSGCH